MSRRWGGRRAAAWSRAVLRNSDGRCALDLEGCTIVAVEADHIKPFSTHPHLMYDVTNGRPACRSCNAKRGNRPIRVPVTIDQTGWFTT